MRQQGLIKESRIGVPLALLLFGFAVSACWTWKSTQQKSTPHLPAGLAEGCGRGRPSSDRFPFIGLQSIAHTRKVTVFGDANARKGIEKTYVEAAVEKWNDACQERLHVPHFVIDWAGDRPPLKDDKDQTYRTSILITFSPNEEAPYDPQEGRTTVAKWLRADNSIKVFGKCGKKKMEMPCETGVKNVAQLAQPEPSIVWKSQWGSMVLAHEIGHALGLDHDLPKCKTPGLMQAVLNKEMNLQVLSEYCRFADDMNNEDCECNKSKPSADDNLCNYSCSLR